jgi:hypothetical protein
MASTPSGPRATDRLVGVAEGFLRQPDIAGTVFDQENLMGIPPSPRAFHDSISTSRQGKAKGGTVPGLRLDRDVAAVPLDDLLADRQSDAGAGELFAFVQPLEHAEDPFESIADRFPVRCLSPKISISFRHSWRRRCAPRGIPGFWYLMALPMRF